MPSMSMSCSQECVQSQELRQELRLTTAQRQLVVQTQTVSLRFELIGAINGGVKYKPQGDCPRCYRRLTPLEILKGFNANPDDLTTCCTGCGMRFEPKLIWSNNTTRIEVPFLCALQTQARLSGLETLSPDEFEKQEPSIYHSAIAHHGRLRNAFAQIGITYQFDEVADIKKKIEGFLGKLADTVIAEISGLKVSTIRRMRQSARIPAFTPASMLEDAEEMEIDEDDDSDE